MPIYTKNTFISPNHPIPTAEDLAVGIPKDFYLSNHIIEAIEQGYTTTTVRLELEPEENGIQRFHILQTWTTIEQAQLYADLVNRVLNDSPTMVDGFVECTVITE